MPRCGLAGGDGGDELGEAGGLSKRARGRDWLLIAASPGSCRSIIRFHRADHWTASVSCGETEDPGTQVGRCRAAAPRYPWLLGGLAWDLAWVWVRVHRMGLYFG